MPRLGACKFIRMSRCQQVPAACELNTSKSHVAKHNLSEVYDIFSAKPWIPVCHRMTFAKPQSGLGSRICCAARALRFTIPWG